MRGELLAAVTGQGWRPEPGSPATVADLVLHLAQAHEWAMAGPTEGNAAAAARMAGGPASPGDTMDRMVAHERGGPPEKVPTRWCECSRALLSSRALERRSPWSATVT